MTYTEAVEYMTSLRAAGMQMGLERMEQGAAALGHPEAAFRSVHIAGTNGKGSTAAMLAAMLSACGHRVGCFCSPYLVTYRDAIQINGKPLSEEQFAACAARVRAAVPTGLSEYEFLTLVVFCAFEAYGVELAVVECCLGGATDATNILPPPLCAVFTPIALDHTAVLGNTIEAIARQKSGIAKPPCDIVCAPSMDDDALGVLYETAAHGGQHVYLPSSATAVTVDRRGTRFVCDARDIRLSMLGAHQADNALTAWQALHCLRRHGIAVDEERAVTALEAVTLPCRQEVVSREPFILLDGAHNPHGIAALCRLFDALELSGITLVIGMLRDKDTEACLAMLSPYCKHMVCCTPTGTPRAMPAEELAAVARRCHPSVTAVNDPLTAVEDAKKAAGQSAVVVAGSFYTAGAVREALYTV